MSARVMAAALALMLSAAEASAASPRSPAIVELYTSEGCSSCPPAEKLLEGLVSREDVLPLAFHVDYWDSLGWRDRFSMKEATARQQSFATTLNLSTVGTPQLVVDGTTAIWGVQPGDLQRALTHARASDIPLVVERNGSSLLVRAPTLENTGGYDLYVVGYLPRAETAIHAGENSGRTITEVNVVRYIRKVPGSRDPERTWNVALTGLPQDAQRLVLLLQASQSGAIVAATKVPLS
jgi:hypothetical protein